VTVMDLVMEEAMMVMMDAKGNWNVEATIVRSLGLFIMKKMIAARNLLHHHLPWSLLHHHHHLLWTKYQVLTQTCWNLLQGKDAVDEIIKEGGVVHLRTPVMRGKVTVMDLVMEEAMMAMLDVKENLYVEATIVRSLVLIIMKKMIAARKLKLHQVKDVVVATMIALSVAHQKILARKGRVTVTDMMSVKGISCAVKITVKNSLACITMKVMTVVKHQFH